MKTPSFWYRDSYEPEPFIEKALSTLTPLYALGTQIDQACKRPHKVPVPVICVGNLVAGGAGKTPIAIALMNLVQKRGLAHNPFFLTRGYGGSTIGPARVNPALDSSANVGDEPLLLTQTAPTIVSRNRAQGAQYAIDAGADLIIMDDGLQNPSLHKDLSFVVIDGNMGFGNQKLLPAGPLREPLSRGLAKADAFVIIGEDQRDIQNQIPKNKPLFRANIQLKANTRITKSQKYLAFTGIGRPQKFCRFLEGLGLNVLDCIEFADHHPFTAEDLESLKNKAATLKATLITTEKDQVRLPRNANILSVPIEIAWQNSQSLVKLLKTL